MRVSNFLITLALIALALPAGCLPSGKMAKQKQESYQTIVKEAIGNRIEAAILVKPDITELEIIRLLKERCASYKRQYSYVTIWMFASKEQYDSDAGLWLAMIVQKGDDSPWEMNIDRDQLQLLHEGPSMKFGLSEEERKKIFWNMADDEDQAMIAAIKAYPYLDDSQPGWTADKAAEQRRRQSQHRKKLAEQYHKDAPQKYGLTRDQLDEINIEGGNKKWPVPPPRVLAELMVTALISPEEANIVIDVCKVEGISIDGTGALVFISHNGDFKPLTVGERVCGGDVIHIYAPQEPDGITPKNSALFYDYRVRMKFADGEKILKNGEYISGAPASPSQPAQVAPSPVPAPTTASAGQSFYSKLCDEVAMAFEQADTWDSAFQNDEALKQYRELLIRAKEAYSTTNLADKDRMRKIIIRAERREREISEYQRQAKDIRANINTPEDLEKWMRKNIRYESDRYGDNYWQAPYETLAKKAGDCEDYAFLAQALLSEIGIKSEVISVQYKEGYDKKGHAICVFERAGGYRFFSGSVLREPLAFSVEQLVEQSYPGWFTIFEMDFRTKSRKQITKK